MKNQKKCDPGRHCYASDGRCLFCGLERGKEPGMGRVLEEAQFKNGRRTCRITGVEEVM